MPIILFAQLTPMLGLFWFPMKELISNLEEIYYKSYNKDIANDTEKARAMKNILTAKIFASTKGSSPKMLLEWLSCVL